MHKQKVVLDIKTGVGRVHIDDTYSYQCLTQGGSYFVCYTAISVVLVTIIMYCLQVRN